MTEIDSLPVGWVRLPLAHAVTPRGEKASPADHPDEPFIGMDHVEAQTGRIVGKVPAGTMKSSAARFRSGDVLYGRLRPYLNKVARPPFDGLASAEFIVFPENGFVLNAYLKYRLRSRDFVSFATHLNEGDRPRVDFAQIGAFQINVPPLPEQHRIVARIEALFSELDAGQDSLTRAQAQLKLYRQSLLDSALRGDLLTRGGWCSGPFDAATITPIFDLVSSVGQGWSPRCENRSAANDDEWAVIKTTAIQHLQFDGDEHKALPDGLEPREHLKLNEGDLLITRAGPRSRVGVACLVRKVRPRLLLCDKAYRLDVDKRKIKPEYLEMALNSPTVLQKIEEIKTGISDSGVNLTQSKFLTISFPVPSFDEQEKTLELLSGILSNVAVMETEITAALAKISALRQSILKQAFSGRLVPQDPDDEPASALLARLRDTAPAPRTRRKTPA